MITSRDEYYEKLFQIADTNIFRTQALNIPENEPIYLIDLNKRTIKAPEFLSVATDHDAEIIYFKVNRYFDGMDLSKTTCVIQYINANNQGALYPVPYCDIQKLANEGMMIIPWSISGLVTAAPGPVKFSIRFYKVSQDEANNQPAELVYNLNTQVASSKILYGIDLSEEMIDYTQVDASVLAQVYAALNEYSNSNAWDWIDL